MPWNSLSVLARFLLALLLCLIASELPASPTALPDAVVHAHTIFLVNDSGFNELGYSTILELSKWGRFDLVDSPQKADLIMRLDSGNFVRAVPDGQFPSSTGPTVDGNIPQGHTRISLLDPKTNTVLWAGTHKTEGGKVKNGHLLDGLREAFDSYEKSRH